MSKRIQALPGTTKSNPQEKGDYDAEGKAVMTLSEFERWLVECIVNVYHKQVHSSLHTPPEAKWKEGLLGSGSAPGIGLPPRLSDDQRVRISLMPSTVRRIQRYGIRWDHIDYWCEPLRSLMNTQPPGKCLPVKVKRDPRDISCVWVWDEGQGEWIEAPYRNPSRPMMSLWELKAVFQYLKENGYKDIDEGMLFLGLGEMEKIKAEAVEKTKSARRRKARDKTHRKKLAEEREGKPHLKLVQGGDAGSNAISLNDVEDPEFDPSYDEDAEPYEDEPDYYYEDFDG